MLTEWQQQLASLIGRLPETVTEEGFIASVNRYFKAREMDKRYRARYGSRNCMCQTIKVKDTRRK